MVIYLQIEQFGKPAQACFFFPPWGDLIFLLGMTSKNHEFSCLHKKSHSLSTVSKIKIVSFIYIIWNMKPI